MFTGGTMAKCATTFEVRVYVCVCVFFEAWYPFHLDLKGTETKPKASLGSQK